MSPILVAFGDVHSPKYINLLRTSLQEITVVPTLVLLSGDIIYRGHTEYLREVLTLLNEKWRGVRILACFGNEEYDDVKDELRKMYPEITWLDDSSMVLMVNGIKVGVVGTRGVLDRPTSWQRKHIPNIYRIYSERLKVIEGELKRLRNSVDVLILLTHYVPSFKLLQGEDRRIWPEMGSQAMERVVLESKVDLVLYAHAHNARVTELRIGSTLFVNTSLPARRSITAIELPSLKLIEVKRATSEVARGKSSILDYV